MAFASCGGVLLTGGTSRRMGRDKASLPIADRPTAGRPGPRGGTLAARTAELLTRVCGPCVEVGPGHTGLGAVLESPAGTGPLTAMLAGWQALVSRGWDGAVLVVATDLPNLTESMLRWLCDREGDRSVVPVLAGRVQPLCARYARRDMEEAARVVARGERSLTSLLEVIQAELAPEADWAEAAGGRDVLADVDTPDDLRRMTGG